MMNQLPRESRKKIERNRVMSNLQDYITRLRRNDPTLISIELLADGFTDSEIALLAREIKNSTTLTSIRVISNAITDVGARMIAEVLKNLAIAL